MTETQQYGFPLPSDASRISALPWHMRRLSQTLEEKLPGAVLAAALPAVENASASIRVVASTAQALADAASTAARAAIDRVTALESSAGFGPSTPEDGTIASYVNQDSSLSRAALDRLYASSPISLARQGVLGDGSDESARLQAAVRLAASTGRLLVCDVPGVIGLGTMVTIGDERANGDQRSLVGLSGNLRVKALAEMDTLLRISGTITGDGNIEADGASLAAFPVYLKNYGRTTLNRVHALGGRVSGVAGEPSGNNNAWSINKLRVQTSGSKVTTKATVASRSGESGWAGTSDTAPYTTWTLESPLPSYMVSRPWAVPAVIFSDKRVMAVRRVVDPVTVEVLNENRAVGTSDTLTLATAAVAFPYHGDVGIWTINNADVRQNANAWALSYGGYGGFVGQWAQQANLAGVVIGKWAIGLSFGAFYTEQSGSAAQGTPWLAVRSTAMTSLLVGPGTNAEPDNWQGMDLDWMAQTKRATQPLHWQLFRKGASPLVPPPAVPLDLPELQPGTRTLTPGTVQAYRRTSGSWLFRINARHQDGVGLVQLSSPEVGSGTPLSITLDGAPAGQTVNAPDSTFGHQAFAYWREGTTWQMQPLGAPAGVVGRVDSAPAYVGQLAVSGGTGYMATGTASMTDWKAITA